MSCRFLGAHKSYQEDNTVEGLLRLIVHSDPNKAIIWEFVSIDGKHYLRVKENFDDSGYFTKGWFVSVSPSETRDGTSNYLALSPELPDAMPLKIMMN